MADIKVSKTCWEKSLGWSCSWWHVTCQVHGTKKVFILHEDALPFALEHASEEHKQTPPMIYRGDPRWKERI